MELPPPKPPANPPPDDGNDGIAGFTPPFDGIAGDLPPPKPKLADPPRALPPGGHGVLELPPPKPPAKPPPPPLEGMTGLAPALPPPKPPAPPPGGHGALPPPKPPPNVASVLDASASEMSAMDERMRPSCMITGVDVVCGVDAAVVVVVENWKMSSSVLSAGATELQ